MSEDSVGNSRGVEVVDNQPLAETQGTDPTMREDTPPEGSSDGEGEKSARERLKQTSIAGLSQKAKVEADDSGNALGEESAQTTATTGENTNNGIRGRPAKKRSFEDLARDDTGIPPDTLAENPQRKRGDHKRMRSRDVTENEQDIVSKLENETTSPVKEESGTEAFYSPGGPGVLVDAPTQPDESSTTIMTDSSAHPSADSKAEPSIGQDTPSSAHSKPDTSSTTETASHTAAISSSSNLHPTSGFANISSTSPFGGAVDTARSPSQFLSEGETAASQSTSKSAFASSGLSAFASSEKSPFGAVASKPSGFGSVTSAQGFASSTGGFGGSSPFATKSSTGFGGSGGGFGSASGFGSSFGGPSRSFAGGSSTFAGPSSAATSFGTSRPIGGATKEEDEEGSETGEQEDEAASTDREAQQDPRFHEQQVDTGEEEEETYFSCRAKLYHFEGEWKERGVGTLKLNVRYVEDYIGAGDEEAGELKFTGTKRKARLVMRADGVHRVILNSPVFRGMKFGAPGAIGSPPTGKTIQMHGLHEGKLFVFLIKINREEMIRDLYDKIKELHEES